MWQNVAKYTLRSPIFLLRGPIQISRKKVEILWKPILVINSLADLHSFITNLPSRKIINIIYILFCIMLNFLFFDWAKQYHVLVNKTSFLQCVAIM